MADRWDDRDRGRGEPERGWSEGRDRWNEERDWDRDRDRGRRSILAGRNWDDNRDRERGWGSGWNDNRERWPGDRDDRSWERHREGGRSLTVGRGELTGEGRDYDREYRSDRDRGYEQRESDRYRDDYDRNRWGSREHFGDRERNYGTSGSAPAFTGAGGTWSAGHSGAAGHEATGGMSSWTGRDRYEDRQRRGTFAGRGPKNYRRADDRICEDVNDRLTRNPDVDAMEVDVTVKDGEVTLVGFVHSRDERRNAEDCAWEVWGVREVHNNLKIHSHEDRDRGVLDKVADAFRGDNRENRENR
jgi:osmotically-inducible protein OsmY